MKPAPIEITAEPLLPQDVLNLVSFVTNSDQPSLELNDNISPARVVPTILDPLLSGTEAESLTLLILSKSYCTLSFGESVAKSRAIRSLNVMAICEFRAGGLDALFSSFLVKSVATALNGDSKLEHLAIFLVMLDTDAIRTISQSAGFSRLITLKIPWSGFSPEAIQEFRKIRTLRTLHLSAGYLGDPGAAAIAGALSSWPELADLALDDQGIGVKGAKALGAAWAKRESAGNVRGLKSLDLGQNELEDEGVVAIANGLMTLRSLDSFDCLSLNDTRLTGTGAKKLSELISLRGPGLAFIRLCRNAIGDSAVSLGDAIGKCAATLVGLELGTCDLGPKTLERIISKLSGARLLSELGLSGNDLGNVVAKSLAQTQPREVQHRRRRCQGVHRTARRMLDPGPGPIQQQINICGRYEDR